MNISEFKTHCLAVLDEIARTGKSITVCKRGKPLATISPAAAQDGYPQHRLFGSVRILGDIVAPPLEPEAWTAETGEL